jgi:hypothetical protein
MNPQRNERIFALLVGDRPVLTFAASGRAEARQLINEKWLRDELRNLKSNGSSLWDGKSKITIREARPEECAKYAAAAAEGCEAEGDLLLAYLWQVDNAHA